MVVKWTKSIIIRDNLLIANQKQHGWRSMWRSAAGKSRLYIRLHRLYLEEQMIRFLFLDAILMRT